MTLILATPRGAAMKFYHQFVRSRCFFPAEIKHLSSHFSLHLTLVRGKMQTTLCGISVQRSVKNESREGDKM